MKFLVLWLGMIGATVAQAATVDDLIKALKTAENAKLRANAARVLAKSQDPRVPPALSEALTDGAALVRLAACAALAKVGDALAVEAVAAMSADKDAHVRRGCSAAAANARRHAPTQVLVDLSHLVSSSSDAQQKARVSRFEKIFRIALLDQRPYIVFEGPLTGYALSGEVICNLKVSADNPQEKELLCKIDLAVSVLPAKAMIGTFAVSGGATIPDAQTDVVETEAALFSALAQSLVKDLVQLVNRDRSNRGEGPLP